MADRPTPDNPSSSPHGTRPPGTHQRPPGSVHPRASGTLPWDLETRARSHASTRTTKHVPTTELTSEDETALLEELDEVLSSTTDSKASKSTNESRVTNLSHDLSDIESRDVNDQHLSQAEVINVEQGVAEGEEAVDSGRVGSERVPIEVDISVSPGVPESVAYHDLAVVGVAVDVHDGRVGPGGAAPHVPPEVPGMSRGAHTEGTDNVNMWSIDEDLTVQGQGMIRQESSLDKRTPRYHQGQFTNYEEMLDKMDEKDPFGGVRPPAASDRKPPVRSSAERAGRQNRTNQGQKDKPPHEKRPRETTTQNSKDSKRDSRRLRKAKSEDVQERPGKNGFTNPAYDTGRRNSTDSTKTYVVGRTDSRLALMDEKKLKAHNPSVRGSIVSLIASADISGFFDMNLCSNELPHKKLGIDVRATKHYIRRSFRHRQCSKYIATEKDGTKCGCGRNQWMHESIGVTSGHDAVPQLKWNPKDHTTHIDPNAFGTIHFHGFGQESQKFAPYLRVDETLRSSNESLRSVWKLLREVWDMPPPKMLVSVTGGAKRFFMKNRLKNSFKRGLINVATSSGAWIITGGTGTGVMQFVGEAVRDHQLTTGGASGPPVVALGIATWGILDNKQALISEGEGSFPAHYSIEHLSNKKGTAPLDPNHTHFLLVDNGTHQKFGVEILFRAALESYISNRLCGISETQGVHIPVVLLVLEGGVNTLETVYQALEKNTPVVIIQGSGRAADFIALAYKEIRGWDEDTKVTLDEDLQRVRAVTMFDWKEGEEAKGVEKVVTTLKKILSTQHRSKLTVFHMDDVDTTKEIDEAILFALLKAKKSDAQQQLNLALAWNRCDVARQQIFDMENRSNWQTLDLNKSMLTALLQDRTDFVQLFMDNGVDLNKFLTKNTLRRLYSDVVNDRSAGMAARLLRHQLQEAQRQHFGIVFNSNSDPESHTGPISCFRREHWRNDMPHLLRIVGRVINSLLGEHNENIYKDPRYIVTAEHQQQELEESESGSGGQGPIKAKQAQLSMAADSASSGLLPDRPLPAYMRLHAYRSISEEGKEAIDDDEDFNIPERDLFLWAILLNRQDLAHLFWRAGQDHIGGALAASSILQSLGKQAEDEEEIELAQNLFKNSADWEEIAVGVLTECYQRDKETTHDLLVRECPTWGHSTLFVMADSSEMMDFMGHSACQTKLNRIWKGKMALHTSMWKILLCMFLPIFLPTIRFATDQFSGLFRPRHKPPPINQPEQESSTGSPTKKQMFGSVNQVGPVDSREETAGVDEIRQSTNKPMTALGVLIHYHQAPITKFCFHTASYLVFLGLFSYFVLTNLAPLSVRSPSIQEYIVWGWAGTLFIEEIRQLATQDPKTLTSKLGGYFESYWNRFDLVMNMCLIISIILRHVLDGDAFVWARMFYAITLAMYFLRFMHFFFVEKNIGPKVIMIQRMLTDLAFFLAIFLTVLLAYGVSVQAIRFPDSPPSINLLKDVLYKPYWHIYGELFLDELEGDVDNCSDDERIWGNATSGYTRCPQKNIIVILMLAVYMVMTNILLLNLLIAMFSHTFERVQENSEKVWRYYFYSLVYEYFDKPTLAPPLIIISHIIRVIRYFISKTKCGNAKTETDFRKKLSATENHRLMTFERGGMENYLLKRRQTDREHIDAKVTNASDRIEKVIEDLEQIKEQVSQTQSSEPDNLMLTMTAREPLLSTTPRVQAMPHPGSEETVTALQDRVAGLEKQLSHQSRSMEKMVSMLKDMRDERAASRRPPSDDHHGPQQADASFASVSSGGSRAYRRTPHHSDPSIEIQDIQPADH